MRVKPSKVIVGLMVVWSAVVSSFAQPTIDWYTIDGGGHMWSSGGAFELGGTIGQPDAGVEMTGGSFTLTGGFWTIPACSCPADVNHDGLRDGRDVQGFVDCLVGVGPSCACADVDGNGVLDMADVATFVTDLLTATACP